MNLRYEIRNSAINGEIVRSLKFHKSRKQFHHYNNGLIIVAKNYSVLDKDEIVRLREAQIVNGLHTVKSIYNAVATKEVFVTDLESECVVQVKGTSEQPLDLSAAREVRLYRLQIPRNSLPSC